jgi:adenylate cyclase
VLSYETYELVRDMVSARPRPPISLKGISRKVVPYVVDGVLGQTKQRGEVISGHAVGLDLFLDTAALDAAGVTEARKRLKAALSALEAST